MRRLKAFLRCAGLLFGCGALAFFALPVATLWLLDEQQTQPSSLVSAAGARTGTTATRPLAETAQPSDAPPTPQQQEEKPAAVAEEPTPPSAQLFPATTPPASRYGSFVEEAISRKAKLGPRRDVASVIESEQTRTAMLSAANPDAWPSLDWYVTTLWLPPITCGRKGQAVFSEGNEGALLEYGEVRIAAAKTLLPFKHLYDTAFQGKKRFAVPIPSDVHPTCFSHEEIHASGRSVRLPYSTKWGCKRYPYGTRGGVPWRTGTYEVMSDMVYFGGDTRVARGRHRSPVDVRVQTNAIFTSMKGMFTQPIEADRVFSMVPPYASAGKRREYGYYLPPTDYSTMWHTLTEVLMPAFHAALPVLLQGHTLSLFQTTPHQDRTLDTPGSPMLTLLRKMRMDHLSCAASPATCMHTPFGEMAKSQLARGGFFMNASTAPGATVSVGRMIIGHPQHCVPIWGSDGVVNAAARRLPQECVKMLWLWRQFFLQSNGVPLMPMHPLPHAPRSSLMLWASRNKDGWARRILNEADVLAKVEEMGVAVVPTFFNTSLRDQARLLQEATHYVCPHGAGLLHSVLLRPGSVLISLDVVFPPFTGMVVEPPWLNVFHFAATLECNMRDKVNTARHARGRPVKNKLECLIFRKPRKERHKHHHLRGEHNNDLSLRVGPFLRLVNATFEDLEGMKGRLREDLNRF